MPALGTPASGILARGALALVPGPLVPVDFQLFIKTFMEMVKNQTPPASAAAKEKAFDKPLKARNLDFYYGNSHMEYYYFRQ